MSKPDRPTIKMLRRAVETLRIHPIAQRRVVQANLKRIIAGLDLDAIGVIHVVEYEINGVKALWVVDGQHRIMALLHHGLGDWTVDVMVHLDVTTDKDASDLMLKFKDRASLNPFDKYVNELEAEKPVAVGTEAIVKRNGLSVNRGTGDGYVTCVSTLKKLYEKDDGRALDLTLSTVTSAWGHTASAVEGKLLEGLGNVFATYNGKVDRPAMVKKLGKHPGGAPAIVGSARALKDIKKVSVSKCVSEVVIDLYNKGRSAGRLEAL